MSRITIKYFNNNKTTNSVENENITLEPLARIMNTEFTGNTLVGYCSCVNRCSLGRYVGVALFSYLADTTTGNYCTFGSRVSIGAFSHPTDALSVHEIGFRNTTAPYSETVLESDSEQYLRARSLRTQIGNDVWVGDNSVVIKGVQIGNGAIVAAGSVVTKDVPAYSIVAGNPAKVIRKRFAEELIERIQATEWWNFNMQELQGVPFEDIEASLEILGRLASRGKI